MQQVSKLRRQNSSGCTIRGAFCSLVVVISFCVLPAAAAPLGFDMAQQPSALGLMLEEDASASTFGGVVSHDEGRYDVALSFFERLFKRRSSEKVEEETKKEAPAKKKVATAPVIKTVTKDPDAAVIAVFGDEFSQDIAWGLKDAFSKVPDVKVEIHSNTGSGLVYRPGRNPLSNPKEVFEKTPFNFAVLMVGLNDRSAIPAQKNSEGVELSPEYEFRSDGWVRAYQREVDRLRHAFAELDKPIFWVGLPPVANEKLSGDMEYLNDLISARLTGREEQFINVWDSFADESGVFSFKGPDLSGEDVRLRMKDGIRFTSEGRRKLAFFVEKLVVRFLSQSVEEDALPNNLASADETALRDGRGSRRDIFVLRKPPLDADQLLDPGSYSTAAIVDSAETAAKKSASRAPLYRIDNFQRTQTP